MSTLAQIVELEAAKLLELARGDQPLSGVHIEALEALCKCARALRVDAPPPAPEDGNVAEDLGLVDKAP